MTSPNPQEGGKHTPGPWRISDEIYIRDASRNGAYIAEIDPMTDFEGNEAEAEANARLIAAAPALLEALKAVHALVSGGAAIGFNPHDGDWAERLFLSQRQTYAAISQAEGRDHG